MFRVFLILAPLIVLAGCKEEVSQVQQTTKAVVVQTAEVGVYADESDFNFPAVVSAVNTIDLSFEVTGRLKQVNLPEGTTVKQGQLLAAIDDAPYLRRVEQATTRLTKAKRDLKRIESLFDKGLASRAQLDNSTTERELAEIDLKQSKQDLAYTKLYAPFDAQIAQRMVDNKNFVQAGQIVAKLQDVSKIYFKINVPERLFTANRDGKISAATATIISSPDKQYAVEYVEHSTQLEPYTQTYQAVFAMDPPKDTTLTPGARAMVKVHISNLSNTLGKVVPLSALVGTQEAGFYVWQFVGDNEALVKVPVTVVNMSGNFVLVQSALKDGDSVVSAGASKMYEGVIAKAYVME
ncbi:efflux RND transporter periplasmic adaptor subunit [Thalassotalea agarivorans]|uniref:RND family efflux transporter, MFP subunit n=1 Tax=Thalassotalea agarivorans TaxID=349064 RepID=A0A1I0AG31_THASX|nr:efflux RND transporter periplasmic adaptor subunit [Thalassotalea agarivorans]SES92209.1 RND family efflux transporter, MFP subunit [Thalassotalea agarivorans]